MNGGLGTAAAAVTQHHDRGGDKVSLVGEMIKIHNLKGGSSSSFLTGLCKWKVEKGTELYLPKKKTS